jgi:asparagine synthase (glutamine-hydrolysing)
MCGIVGIAALGAAPQPRPEQIAKMCRTLIHRGPDDEGVSVRDGVGLGNRRLTVIDPSGGRQPMENESGSVRVVQNGEIYNFRELRRELQLRGHSFRTDSDTEVIVRAYEEYGLDFPSYLNGMFAIALHDAKQRRLVLVRDHLGIKPLYYSLVAGQHLLWGSEIKALLAAGLQPPSLDVDALGQFLSWEYVPGRQTLLQNTHKLLPAEMLVADLTTGAMRRQSYWEIPEPDRTRQLSPADWEQCIDETITRCVQRQLVSDVPLGAFLSGGVDSSLVVSAMGPTKAFSIGFDDPSYNELAYAKQVADHLGVEQISRQVRPDVGSLFDTLMKSLDDPIGDSSIFPTFLISCLAREQVTVALSGDGGDELFGGYETYLAEKYAYWYQYLPQVARAKWFPSLTARLPPSATKKGPVNKLKRFVEGASHPEQIGHARWRMFASDALKQSLFTPAAASKLITPTGAHIQDLLAQAKDRPGLDKSLYVDVKSYLSDNCLVKVDRMSMATSLEVRVPLLDKELVELAFQIPPNLKVAGGNSKAILKRVAARHVPRSCVYRPKEGFSIPLKHWLGHEFRPIVEHYLAPGRIAGEGLFEFTTIDSLKQAHFAGQANHSHVLWSLIVFEAWKERWLDGVG